MNDDDRAHLLHTLRRAATHLEEALGAATSSSWETTAAACEDAAAECRHAADWVRMLGVPGGK